MARVILRVAFTLAMRFRNAFRLGMRPISLCSSLLHYDSSFVALSTAHRQPLCRIAPSGKGFCEFVENGFQAGFGIGIDLLRGVLLTGGLLVPAILFVALVGLLPMSPAGITIGTTAVVTILAASVGSAARTTAPDVRAWVMVCLGGIIVLSAIWMRTW